MKGILGNKIRTIVCAACGKTVTNHFPPRQRFCSIACHRRSPKPEQKNGKTFQCAICKTPVYIPKHRLGLRNYFCCPSHANEWQGRGKTIHTCKSCGNTFKWSPSRSKLNNIKYCSIPCRQADPEYKAHLVAANAAQQQVRTNRFERDGYAMLDLLGLQYVKQHIIGGKFTVDAFVSDGVVIQFDGDYWHGNPSKYPNPDHRQAKRIKLDKSQDRYMAKCGYRVVRIWESDFRRDLDAVRQRLQQILAPA